MAKQASKRRWDGRTEDYLLGLKLRTITVTGRARSQGVQTRHADAYRKTHRKAGKPLPMDMQCHPPAKKHTPLHPGCEKNIQTDMQVADWIRQQGWTWRQMIHGKGLRKTGAYTLRHHGTGDVLGYCDDVQYAMGWTLAFWQVAKGLVLVEK